MGVMGSKGEMVRFNLLKITHFFLSVKLSGFANKLIGELSKNYHTSSLK